MIRFKGIACLSLLLLSSYGTVVPVVNKPQTIWRNLGLWFEAAQQYNINTGLIEVMQRIVELQGCTGIQNDSLYKERAKEMFQYLTSLPDFESARSVKSTNATEVKDTTQRKTLRLLPRCTLIALRVQTLQHFCPDLNVPESEEAWDGTTVEDAAAWLQINQTLDIDRATNYIGSLLLLNFIGY